MLGDEIMSARPSPRLFHPAEETLDRERAGPDGAVQVVHEDAGGFREHVVRLHMERSSIGNKIRRVDAVSNRADAGNGIVCERRLPRDIESGVRRNRSPRLVVEVRAPEPRMGVEREVDDRVVVHQLVGPRAEADELAWVERRVRKAELVDPAAAEAPVVGVDRVADYDGVVARVVDRVLQRLPFDESVVLVDGLRHSLAIHYHRHVVPLAVEERG